LDTKSQDRWRDDRLRSSTTATTPESIHAKTPITPIDDDDYGSKQTRRPVGGIAVLPPMEMEKIKSKRNSYGQEIRSPVQQKTPPTTMRSPTSPPTQKTPPTAAPRNKSPFSESLFDQWDARTQEVCYSLFNS
jgi:hypothetical protein